VNPNEVRKYESLDVVIVGAGAAGVGIGAALATLDLDSYAVLERDTVGASFRQWPDEMRLITPSFPSNSFGARDLNAVTTDTSPAFALDREHPTGREYAEYLQGVVDFHDLPVRTGVAVESLKRDDDGFVVHTSEGVIHSRFVVWAAGQFGRPNDDPFPGRLTASTTLGSVHGAPSQVTVSVIQSSSSEVTRAVSTPRSPSPNAA